MDQLFLPLSYGLLVLLMALCAWWAFRSFKAEPQRWGRFAVAVALFVLLGFGWNFFPLLVFLILGPIFGWSFS